MCIFTFPHGFCRHRIHSSELFYSIIMTRTELIVLHGLKYILKLSGLIILDTFRDIHESNKVVYLDLQYIL